MVVVSAGKVEELGTPQELLARPDSAFRCYFSTSPLEKVTKKVFFLSLYRKMCVQAGIVADK